jgi:hypothetical protein
MWELQELADQRVTGVSEYWTRGEEENAVQGEGTVDPI